ncbi:COG2426 family protein [Sporosalibacterium faouarense]|uniref:COG2426 family protein n=1 Tax=Sporosalibacterium faouarense TaxID=516123 RepID=UPI00141C6E18|nr:small multi-drug export protein [Sporosalibacterium faouarense]MTI46816.1 small multi-drug export protein [Bacillota bacterium]
MLGILQDLKNEIIITLIAAVPVIELRGAIPIAISMGFSPLHSMILSVIGNMLPVPFLLILLEPLFKYFGKTKMFGGLVAWLKRRTLRRSKRMKKYTILGLFLLVAIPLPATGAWTGTVAAILFNVKFRYAFLTILAGVITAGIIVVVLSTHAISLFGII